MKGERRDQPARIALPDNSRFLSPERLDHGANDFDRYLGGSYHNGQQCDRIDGGDYRLTDDAKPLSHVITT